MTVWHARMWYRLLKWASFRLGRFTGSDFAYKCQLRFLLPRCSRYGNEALKSFACWEWNYRIESGTVFYDCIQVYEKLVHYV